MAESKYTLGWWATVLTIITILGGGITTGVTLLNDVSTLNTTVEELASKQQLAIARNKIDLHSTNIHILLLHVKNDNKPREQWSVEDQLLYDGLIEGLKSLKKEERELSGIPTGAPQ